MLNLPQLQLCLRPVHAVAPNLRAKRRLNGKQSMWSKECYPARNQRVAVDRSATMGVSL